jgi:4-hydroxy-tetrahydrodipicolinate synthase
MDTKFTGSMVALVTPFDTQGDIDWQALERLLDLHLQSGTHALVLGGTTGESATMTYEERHQILEFAINHIKGRIPVIAGTGSSSTRIALELSQQAKQAGADGLLIVTPPYNKPTQEGLIDYYTTIAHEIKMPVILYNVPGRTCCDLLPVTVAKLADNPYIVAIKDATADLRVGSEIIERCGDQISLLSGDDFTALPLLAIGGDGWISVTANIAPREMVDMYDAWKKGDISIARSLHYQLLPLHRAMFIQSNPIPVKEALYLMGLCHKHVRSPLVVMRGGVANSLAQALAHYGLIESIVAEQ